MQKAIINGSLYLWSKSSSVQKHKISVYPY